MKFVPHLAVLVLLLSGCASKPVEQAVSAPDATPVMASKAVAVSASAETEVQRLGRYQTLLGKKSIYFKYDDVSLDTPAKDVIKNQAETIRRLGVSSVVLEGNADERGSREYNLALGQKRAETVRKALALSGVPYEKMEAVSFGSEKPRATCAEERCWRENRRVDFAVGGK
jgi:peptidoglycan-associated lipoprotein